MPIGYGLAFYDRRINWMYHTEPDPGTGGPRQLLAPRQGARRLLVDQRHGVCSRAFRGDFDDWEAMGNPGWGWNDVLPYFKKSETSDQGETEWRGGEGPLHVATMERDLHPACENFLRAGEECGFHAVSRFQRRQQRRRRLLPEHRQGRLAHVQRPAPICSRSAGGPT
jgi:choline dehydrogenase